MGVVRLFFLYAFLSLLCLDDTKTRAINIHRGFPWCFSPRKRYDFKNQGDILRLRCFSQKKNLQNLQDVFLQHVRQPEVQQCGHVFSIEVSLIKVHRKTCRGPWQQKKRVLPRCSDDVWNLPYLKLHIFAPEKKVVWSKMETESLQKHQFSGAKSCQFQGG